MATRSDAARTWSFSSSLITYAHPLFTQVVANIVNVTLDGRDKLVQRIEHARRAQPTRKRQRHRGAVQVARIPDQVGLEMRRGGIVGIRRRQAHVDGGRPHGIVNQNKTLVDTIGRYLNALGHLDVCRGKTHVGAW